MNDTCDNPELATSSFVRWRRRRSTFRMLKRADAIIGGPR